MESRVVDRWLLLFCLCYVSSGTIGNIPECSVSTFGHEYRGHVNKTISGRVCQRWDAQFPHEHSYNESLKFPERSVELAENYCRNPVLIDLGGLWCYTTDPTVRFEYCDIPMCSAFPECKLTDAGQSYRGYTAVTSSGTPCQPWNLEDEVLTKNHCRNPDSKPGGPWCFTDAGQTQWDYCDVPFCKPSASCTTTTSGAEYVGTQSTTKSGVHCQRWDDKIHHISNYTDDTDFPDDTVSDATDFCRNPRGEKNAPWCYTLSPDLEWDYCNIDRCDACRLTDTGSDYAGVVSVTSSGYTCQRWNSQTPHVHNFTDENRFPDKDLESSNNYCRNPDKRAGGPWCHTTDPAVTWETCDIPLCISSDEMLQPIRDIKHVIHVGIDGLHPCFVDAPAPNIMPRLSENGAWTLNARTVYETVSGPSWISILCGSSCETSGVMNNGWLPPWKGYHQPITPASGNDVPIHCVFDVLKKQDKNVRTAAFYLWDFFQYMTSTGSPGNMDIDIYCDPSTPLAISCDNSTVRESSDYIRDVLYSAESSYTFIYLMSLDEAGHTFTWCNDRYMSQVTVVDEFVGQILDMIDNENAQDDVMVVLTTDHGGENFNHGRQQDSDLIIPMFFRGPGIKKNYEMQFEVRNIDVTATIMRAMGYNMSPWWKGLALEQIFENKV